MIEIATPRGALKVPERRAADARDRLFRMPPPQRLAARDKAKAVLERRDSLKAAAVLAAAAAVAAIAIPTAAA